jgi:pimeloyl-ACP methyl ester carboxylesterase
MTANMSVNNQSPADARERYTIGSVISQDGTVIGYRQYGHGLGIVLVQGAMGTAQNFSHLAELLSESFTVYVPDRRGRGLSPLPFREDYTIQRDVEDLEALLVKTDTHHVFALSSGAVIGLTAAITSKTIHKLAAFEPPLFLKAPMPTAELARFNRAMAQGNLGAALTAAGKAVQLVPIMNYIPGWLLTFLSNRMLASEAKQPKGDDLTLRELTLTLQYDFRVVTEMHGAPERWRAIGAEVLLLGGSKSPAYLSSDLDALEKVLPHVARMEFPGLGHAASWNYDKRRNPTGNPEPVAQMLRRFFSEPDMSTVS